MAASSELAQMEEVHGLCTSSVVNRFNDRSLSWSPNKKVRALVSLQEPALVAASLVLAQVEVAPEML